MNQQEQEKINQKVDTIIQKLNRYLKSTDLIKKQNQSSNYIKQLFAKSPGLQKSAIIVIILSSLFLMLIIWNTNQVIQTNPTRQLTQEQAQFYVSWIFSCLIGLIVGFLMGTISIIIELYNSFKTSTQLNRQNVLKNTTDAIEAEKISEELFNEFDNKTLGLTKKALKISFDESKSNYNTFSKFLPILLIIVLVMSVYITGIDISTISKKYNLDYFFPGVTLFAFLLFLVQYFYELDIQSKMIKYEKCLMILEQAQAMAEDIQTNQNNT
ncbi:MAG: hypothetical protein MUD14_08995 [Hydrococcus sp. Prado102]|jgi:CDP-diglyceride synthetase|nr:hypothetical protein [Hydrococcus sp. Prado102]